MIGVPRTPERGSGFSMNKLDVSLENCYGIRKLQHRFDFSDTNVSAIYAPNGSMKTSLALTFAALANNRQPEDRRYRDRVTRCDIIDENGNHLPADSIVVLTPYKEPLEERWKTPRSCWLIANSANNTKT
jgi:hypothetical protein